MVFQEWYEDNDELDLYNFPNEAAEIIWNKALEVAAKEVKKIALHHNTIVCAVDVINRNRTDT